MLLMDSPSVGFYICLLYISFYWILEKKGAIICNLQGSTNYRGSNSCPAQLRKPYHPATLRHGWIREAVPCSSHMCP